MRFLFVLFIIVPIIEITLLIQVGQAIGAWYTVGLVLLSAFIGVNMLRYQGFATLRRAQNRMASGEMPGTEMVEGIVLAVGGALLLTPGFVTDVIGFLCLIPFTRQGFVKLLLSKVTLINPAQGFHAHTHAQPDDFMQGPAGGPSRKPHTGASDSLDKGDVIEGEYRRED